MPPESAGAELAEAEPAGAELTAAFEVPAEEPDMVAEGGVPALDEELPAALEAEDPAVLDEEQAVSEPATAIAMHAVITVRRVVEERATLVLPGVE